MAGPIRISILANASQARREIDSVAGSTSKMGGFFKKFGKVAAAGVAVAGVAAAKMAVDSVKAASDAQQSLGATETVFGKYADTVVRTSEKAANAVGLSANEYRENANLIGSLFKNQGVATDKLASKTDEMVRKGADLAATFGGPTKNAVEALGSAFKGEFDPLEKYGISIKQSTVNTEADILAKKQYGQALSDLSLKQQTALKQQATMNLINKQSADSTGAFAKEANTLAGQQQRLAAQFENIKTRVGMALIPVLVTLLTVVNKNLVPAFETVAAAVRPVIDAVQNLFQRFSEGAESSGRLREVVGQIGAFFQGQFLPAVMGVVNAFRGYLSVVLPIIQQVAQAIFNNWGKIAPYVRQIFNAVKSIVVGILGIVQQIFIRATQIISAVWNKWGSDILRFITSALRQVLSVVGGLMKAIAGVVKTVLAVLKGDWSGAWNGIKQIVSGVWQAIKGIVSLGVNVVKSVMSAAWAVLRSLTVAAWNGLKSAVSSAISGVMSLVSSIPGRISGALGNLGSILYDAGASIIGGLIDGIESMIGAVQSKLSSLTNMIPDWKGPRQKDKRLLRPAGRMIIQGLIQGFNDGTKGVEKVLKNLTKYIEDTLGRKLTPKWKRWLRSADDALVRNAKAQDKNTQRIKDATKALADMIKARKQYAASIKSSVVGTGDVTGLGEVEDGSTSISLLIDQLKDRVNNAKRYAELIRQLTAQGLNKTSIKQLIDAGVEGGLATAEALAYGGKEAISEVNSLTRQLQVTGSQLGKQTAATMYNAGIQAQRGFLQGLRKDSRALDKAARRLATILANSVRKALGIASPSRVFKYLGKQTVLGMKIALEDIGPVKKAAYNLGKAAEKGFGQPHFAVAGAGLGAGGRATVRLVLTAEQISQIQRGREIQADLDAFKAAGGRARAV